MLWLGNEKKLTNWKLASLSIIMQFWVVIGNCSWSLQICDEKLGKNWYISISSLQTEETTWYTMERSSLLFFFCLLSFFLNFTTAQFTNAELRNPIFNNLQRIARQQASDECPDEQLSFEMVTGYVYTAPADMLDSQPGTLMLTDCIDTCRRNSSCKSINYETGLCVLFASNADEGEGK